MAQERCLCGNCCGCKGTHAKGFCPSAKCSKFKQKENIVDILAEAEAIGDGDKSHLEARVEKMQGEIASGNDISRWIEPIADFQVQDHLNAKDIEVAASVDDNPRGQPAQAPRINDFYLIDTTMSPDDFLRLVNTEVLGNYDAQDRQGQAEFGLMVFQHVQGLPQPGTALAVGPGGSGQALASARPMIVAKFDAGPWSWYDNASIAIMSSIVKRVGRRGWRCGWAVDRQWSWVEHWRQDKRTGEGRMTETLDGPANATVTAKARDRWGIDVRAAFDDLMRVAQWEALRQWLLCGKDGDQASLPVPFVARASLLAGNLQCGESDREWVPQKWAELFPGRKPWDGPLHLQSYYVPAPGTTTRPIAREKLVTSYGSEPKSLD